MKQFKLTKSVFASFLVTTFFIVAQLIQAQSFTVTFETNGGTEISPLNDVTVINEEPAVTKVGNYRFAGWFDNSALKGNKVSFPYIVTQDTKLYARFTTPAIFAPAFAAQGVAILDNDLNLWGTFLAGYPGMEEYSLLAGVGIHNKIVYALDIGAQGLFAYDTESLPPVFFGNGDNVGSGANSIIIDGDYAYVIISGSDLIRVIDLAATSTNYGNQRLVTTIPARMGSGTQTTNPTFGTMFNDKLYVSLTGVTAPGGGDKLLEIAVRDIDTTIPPATPQILATRDLDFPASELVVDHPAAPQNYASPAGVAAANGKLYVALGNLGLVSVPVPVGPGYLAVVDPETWTKTLYVLPDSCRNARHVLATTNRIYVACPGLHGTGDHPIEALVVFDAATMNIINETVFQRCEPGEPTNGPDACFNPAPGRMAIAGNRLIIADERYGRLFITDLDGNVPSEFSEGKKIFDLECNTPTECYQSVLDVIAVNFPVVSITDVPETVMINTPLSLSGTVNPYESNFKDIVWSVNETGVSIEDDIFISTKSGIIEITATVVDGIAIGTHYTQKINISVQPFPVSDITDVPEITVCGKPLILIGTVEPDNATNKDIIWSVANAGTTGATITGNTLNTTGAGTLTVTAKIINGLALNEDFSKNFNITVHVSVTDIVNVPTTATIDVPLELSYTVEPESATFQTVVWSILNDGNTNAIIWENIFFASNLGTAFILATITDGVEFGTDYEKPFFITVKSVGIENVTESKIIIYPNPTTGKFSVVSSEMSVFSIEIFDITGRLVHREPCTVNRATLETDISHLSAGIYFVKVGDAMLKVVKK